MIGEDIDEPRNPAGMPRDPLDRAIAEQGQVGRAGDVQPTADVLVRFSRIERGDVAPQADPVSDVAEFSTIEPGRELRLSDQKHLQQLAGAVLAARELADLLECRRIEVVRLVDDEDGLLAGLLTLREEVVQCGEPPRRRLLGFGNS